MSANISTTTLKYNNQDLVFQEETNKTLKIKLDTTSTMTFTGNFPLHLKSTSFIHNSTEIISVQ
jgi:hypothetical protein